MANIDKVQEYNEGTVWPNNYDDTYLATKHIQSYPLELKEKLVDELRTKVAAAGLFFDDEDLLKEIATGIIKGNVILQGPPGTGKTTIASIICSTFNVDFDVVTAVSDWTTYDTIGGLQPSVDEEGNEIISGKNGRIVESIIKCCNTVLQKEKHTGSKQASWLIVDELNRSEIDKVFGDLFTVFGSDNLEQRKIPLWFENDKNKQILYVPRRYRIIGLMNNVDKNFVFDLSHGLARRFTIISILPPKIESMDIEIERCKDNLSKTLSSKIGKIGSQSLEETYLKSLLDDAAYKKEEAILVKLLKLIRYEESDSSLGLQYGTAQIMDLFENILINMILDEYLNVDAAQKESKIKRIIDSAVNDRIIPQLDGYDYLKLKQFYEYVSEDSDYSWFIKSMRTLKSLV
ncbi:MAG: AAA family ATPase [Dethiosulfatibacter sp.]|nr:AAA family ATPase [Dethiosulfatibacter sp.]